MAVESVIGATINLTLMSADSMHRSWHDPRFAEVTKQRFAGWLADSKRGRARFAAAAVDHLQLTPKFLNVGSPITDMLAWDSQNWQLFCRHVGLYWHGKTVATLIDKKSVAALSEAVGEEFYRDCLIRKDLWVAAQKRGPVQKLIKLLVRDGESCIFAWTKALNADVAEVVRLRLPRTTHTEIAQQHAPLAKSIVAHVAQLRLEAKS